MSLLERDRTALVVVDVQEAFRSYSSFAQVASQSAKLVQGARLLERPSDRERAVFQGPWPYRA